MRLRAGDVFGSYRVEQFGMRRLRDLTDAELQSYLQYLKDKARKGVMSDAVEYELKRRKEARDGQGHSG